MSWGASAQFFSQAHRPAAVPPRLAQPRVAPLAPPLRCPTAPRPWYVRVLGSKMTIYQIVRNQQNVQASIALARSHTLGWPALLP